MADIRLKTLTPLWTGGVDGRADRVHETGLLGSLRWWYEAIVRGLGGTACDPSRGECQLGTQMCDVCQLFGATGWRRRFRLAVINDQTAPLWQGDQLLNIRPPGRNRGWFLPPGRMGEFTLRLDSDQESIARVLALLRFVERWGSLGAKPQLGYGVVEIQNWDELRSQLNGFSWKQAAQQLAPNKQTSNPGLPNLCDFGFFRYRFQPPDPAWWSRIGGFERVTIQVRPFATQTVPVAPALKNAWRFQHWQRAWGDDQRFWGRVAADRIRGRVAVSWAYPHDSGWEIRGSAWLADVRDDLVWQMLIDARIWNTTLGVSGKLETEGPQKKDALLTFLERI
ncbi:MAG: type III-B CRISPR module RAMP protein Cmr1 [Roseiflexus sp.]|nr:type III-B CRISPR module RAMP protein Cmr1 [Roseiflexus sp.]MDW8147299.1 type III-B CRISPR module RAMP protein Cmr1 [Roseiflexaceae bacterium]